MKNIIKSLSVICLLLIFQFPAFGICLYQTVTGRVLNANAGGISATVQLNSMFGIDSVLTRTVRSNQFGYYAVPNVISCENYEFRPKAKGYVFEPDSLTIIPSVELTDINFFGLEN